MPILRCDHPASQSGGNIKPDLCSLPHTGPVCSLAHCPSIREPLGLVRGRLEPSQGGTWPRGIDPLSLSSWHAGYLAHSWCSVDEVWMGLTLIDNTGGDSPMGKGVDGGCKLSPCLTGDDSEAQTRAGFAQRGQAGNRTTICLQGLLCQRRTTVWWPPGKRHGCVCWGRRGRGQKLSCQPRVTLPSPCVSSGRRPPKRSPASRQPGRPARDPPMRRRWQQQRPWPGWSRSSPGHGAPHHRTPSGTRVSLDCPLSMVGGPGAGGTGLSPLSSRRILCFSWVPEPLGSHTLR